MIERNPKEAEIAQHTLERYSGCESSAFQSNLLLTNFPRYVDHFAQTRGVQVCEGSMFKVAHDPKEEISILDFKIGSPAAALVVDICSFLPIRASAASWACAGDCAAVIGWEIIWFLLRQSAEKERLISIFRSKFRLWLIF